MKVPQTRDDLLAHLRDCIGFLTRSANAFNQGYLSEAKRMATTIRVMVYDTKNSTSLLKQLNYKNSMRFINSAYPVVPHNLVTHQGLVAFGKVGTVPSFIAIWNDPSAAGFSRGYQSFDEWWNYVVIVDQNRATFTRRELVLALANQDGGAHVDPGLDATYASLAKGNSLGWTIQQGVEIIKPTVVGPLAAVELHSVQQIAYELLTSVSEHQEAHPG